MHATSQLQDYFYKEAALAVQLNCSEGSQSWIETELQW